MKSVASKYAMFRVAVGHERRSTLGGLINRWDRALEKEGAKLYHASIRAERRRKRKAFQARKVGDSRGKYNPKQISERTAVAFLAAALLEG